jgi:glycosyltransferase involved in cell wall biosynthesis
MRIGILAPPWVPIPPPRYGGTEGVIDLLARGLQAAGHEVFLWTTGESTCPVPRGHVLPTVNTHMGLAATELHHVLRGYDALRRWGADIIHDHSLTGPVYSLSLPGPPVVTTIHGCFDEGALELYRAVGCRVPVIAISQDQASRGHDVKIAAVIHHGIDVDAFPFGKGCGDEHGPYMAFLGRMAPQKGAHLAAEATRAAGWRLVIAAKMREPAERDYFEEEVEPLLGDSVTFLGEVDKAARVRLLQGATALLNPIRWPEQFGLVMVEAMACGTPVLSFPEGSAPEIVGDGVTGFLCNDVADLAKRMADVGDLDRTACRASVAERFSVARMVDAHVALYQRIVGERAR